MGNLIRSNIADIDLLKPLKRDNVGALLPEGDALANRYGANVYRGREPVDLTGYTAQCWFIRPSKDTLLLDCVIDGNTVYVDLQPECYNAIGLAVMTFKLVKDNVTTTIRIVDGYVRETQTDVAAGNVAVNIIEAVERAEAAAERAESAGGCGSGGTVSADMSAHIINLTDNGDGTYTSDTTFAEAEEIINSGRTLMALHPIIGLPLALAIYSPDAAVGFHMEMGGFGHTVMITPADDVLVDMSPVNAGFILIDNTGNTIVQYDGTEAVATHLRDIAYVKSVNGVGPDHNGNIAISVSSDSGAETIPEYVRTEAETVARLVNQHQSNDSIIFPFLTDAHCGYYQDTANAATTLAGQLLHLIGQRVPYDFIVNGGDMANGAWDTTRALSFDQIEDYTALTSDAHRGVPAIWVPGNHDDAPYMATADRVTQKEMFALIGRKNRQSGAICPNGCNYGYLDLESQHLRVIYLDTDDKRGWGTVQVGNGETAPAYLNAHNVGGDQLRWLAETALDFSGKDNAADWSVVVVSHVALDVSGTYTDVVSGTSYANSTANAASVLSAYASGGSGSITHNGILVPYDYSALDARATVICCVHGHGHKFVNGTVSGILSIGCPNVMNGRERVSSDGNTYTKTAGTANGTSFCIMTIDRENRKVYADCVGVGPDREFEYTTEVMPYTNLLPISTDASGAVYNGKGYKENTYLSSGNDGTKAGIYASGYIPGVLNEYGMYVWYFKNVGMITGQDAHRLCIYDGNKTYKDTKKTTVTSGGTFTYGADGNITKISLSATTYPDGMYIRICCDYLGDDSVITANEPIE